ncbi:ATP-binding cassette domain-containing protein [Deferribacter abyssi]|uniref:ATP-binding cassette domain-containing protein n=1 Tax=Deferribacter abyssi TaxID=213806 RepID=UPI003C209FC9
MILKVENITKRFKKSFSLKDISFTLSKGEILGLVGPDGAGKSTLMKIIANVMDFDEGKLYLFDKEIDRKKNYDILKDRIAYMPQGLGLNLYQKLSVEENIDFFAELKGLDIEEIRDRKDRLLRVTGLDRFRKRLAMNLSGGMKQKLGICCSLIHKPELIILDEPTVGVDPISRRELWDLFMDFVNRENLTVIISTSYLDEAERCDKVIFLHDGMIKYYGRVGKKLFENINVVEKPVSSYEVKHYYEKYRGVRFRRNIVRYIIKKFEDKEKNFLVEPVFEDIIMNQLETKYLDVDFPRINSNFKGDDIIVLDKISKTFGDFYALKEISFSVKRGEIFGLLGPNGAGKTTLIKILTGLYKQSDGTFEVFGRNSLKQLKYKIGYMSQKFSLYSDLSVEENIEYYANIYGVKSLEKFENIIKTIGLSNYKKEIVKRLPLGFKQRLALICSILHMPEIVFLDEPTSGVDPVERDVFWQLITKLSRAGITVIVTTHYMSEAEYCDRIALISAGQLIALDEPEKLKKRLTNEVGDVYDIHCENYYMIYKKLKKEGYKASLLGRKIRIYARDESFKNLLDINCTFIKSVPTMEDVFVYYA